MCGRRTREASQASRFAEVVPKSSTMKVILGVFSFAQPGGTESYVLTVARELERLGHDAVIAAQE